MSRLGWGIDGFGRCFLNMGSDSEILLCGMLGTSGAELVWIYEEFGV